MRRRKEKIRERAGGRECEGEVLRNRESQRNPSDYERGGSEMII